MPTSKGAITKGVLHKSAAQEGRPLGGLSHWSLDHEHPRPSVMLCAAMSSITSSFAEQTLYAWELLEGSYADSMHAMLINEELNMMQRLLNETVMGNNGGQLTMMGLYVVVVTLYRLYGDMQQEQIMEDAFQYDQDADKATAPEGHMGGQYLEVPQADSMESQSFGTEMPRRVMRSTSKPREGGLEHERGRIGEGS